MRYLVNRYLVIHYLVIRYLVSSQLLRLTKTSPSGSLQPTRDRPPGAFLTSACSYKSGSTWPSVPSCLPRLQRRSRASRSGFEDCAGRSSCASPPEPPVPAARYSPGTIHPVACCPIRARKWPDGRTCRAAPAPQACARPGRVRTGECAASLPQEHKWDPSISETTWEAGAN